MPLNPPVSGRAKVYTIAQAVLSGLGILTGLPAAAFLFLIAVLSVLTEPELAQNNSSVFVLAWMALVTALAMVPGLISAIYRLMNKPLPSIPTSWLRGLGMAAPLVWVLSLAGAFMCMQVSWLNLFSSVFVVPLITIPIILVVVVAARKLSTGSPLRNWGAVTFHLSVSLPIILTAEIILMGVLIVIFSIWASGQPELTAELLKYRDMLVEANLDPLLMENILLDLVKTPAVITGSMLLVAVIIPMMEEFFKPMALWFLAGKQLTPAQGFVGGMISGACFALLESLGAVGAPTEPTWFLLLLGRNGTGVLHIALSGLTGWGLASLFHERKWLRGIGAYFLAVLLHGTWNFFALITGIVPILPAATELGALPLFLSQIGFPVLVGLFMLNVVILYLLNRRLQPVAQ